MPVTVYVDSTTYNRFGWRSSLRFSAKLREWKTLSGSLPRKSQANVLDLQDEIERLEAMIADRRELYNDQVYRYNTRIATLPTLVLAWIFGWRAREFFAADPSELEHPAATL